MTGLLFSNLKIQVPTLLYTYTLKFLTASAADEAWYWPKPEVLPQVQRILCTCKTSKISVSGNGVNAMVFTTCKVSSHKLNNFYVDISFIVNSYLCALSEYQCTGCLIGDLSSFQG